MGSQHLIIRTCRHILPDGCHCRGAAVRGRACCRHHLDARARLHNMARARRLVRIPRLCVAMTWRDVALNRSEVLRVVNTGSVDLATARLMLWAMDLSAAALPVAPDSRQRTSKPNIFYHLPATPLFEQNYTENPSEVLEKTWGGGEGVRLQSGLGPEGRKRLAERFNAVRRKEGFNGSPGGEADEI